MQLGRATCIMLFPGRLPRVSSRAAPAACRRALRCQSHVLVRTCSHAVRNCACATRHRGVWGVHRSHDTYHESSCALLLQVRFFVRVLFQLLSFFKDHRSVFFSFTWRYIYAHAHVVVVATKYLCIRHVANTCTTGCSELTSLGVQCVTPTAGYYCFPNFERWRNVFKKRGITTGTQMCDVMLNECKAAVSFI